MPRKPTKNRAAQLNFRADPANNSHIERRARASQFGNKTNYLNWLVERDRTGQDDALQTMESRLLKTIDNLEAELKSVRVNYATLNAFVHAFARMYLVNTPELDAQSKRQVQSTAKARYQRLLEQAAELMTYDQEADDGQDQEN